MDRKTAAKMNKYINLCKYINHNWYGEEETTAVEKIATMYSKDTLMSMFKDSLYIELFFLYDEYMQNARRHISKLGCGNSYYYHILPVFTKHSKTNEITSSISIGLRWVSLDINTIKEHELLTGYNIDIFYQDKNHMCQMFKVNKSMPYYTYLIASETEPMEIEGIENEIYTIKDDMLEKYKYSLKISLDSMTIDAIKQSMEDIEEEITYKEYLDKILTSIVYLETMVTTLYVSEKNNITLIAPKIK